MVKQAFLMICAHPRCSVGPCSGVDGAYRLQIVLPPHEASERLNFVLKDAATNTWYDHNGSNFAAPLTSSAAAATEVLSPHSDSGSGNGKAATRDNVVAASADVQQLPTDLCNVWAWIMWDEVSGCCTTRTTLIFLPEYRMN